MIPSFAHHTLSLLAVPGQQGAIDGRAPLSAVKSACKEVERIDELLRNEGRVEIALIPPEPDFFGDSSWMAERRQMLWETISRTPHLYWVVPTSHPENILSMPPPGGDFDSSGNLCLGVVATGTPDGLDEKLDALRSVPVPWRMLLLHSLGEEVDLREKLDSIDWVVVSGDSDMDRYAPAIESACHETGAAFLFSRHGDGSGDSPGISLSGDGSSHPDHPFGPEIQLRRPTLSGREPMSASVVTPFPPPVPEVPDQIPESPQAPAPAPAIESPKFEILPPTPTDESSMVLDPDTIEFKRLDKVVRAGMAAFIEVGTALAEIHRRKLWKAGNYGTWEDYCKSVAGMSKSYAHRLMKGSEVALELSESLPIGNDSPPPVSESQVRPLLRLKDPEQRRQAWNDAASKSNGNPTARTVKEAVAGLLPAKNTTKPRPDRSERKRIIGELKVLVGERKSWEEVARLLRKLEEVA